MAKKNGNDKKIKKISSDDFGRLYKIFMANDFNGLMEFINSCGLEAVDRDGKNVFLNCIICVIHKQPIGLLEKMIEQIEELNINFQDKDGWSALHIAVQEKNMELLELLLKNKNIDIDIQDGKGNTALMRAFIPQNPDENIIIKLLEAGADLNKDCDGDRPNVYINETMEKINKYIKGHNIKIIK